MCNDTEYTKTHVEQQTHAPSHFHVNFNTTIRQRFVYSLKEAFVIERKMMNQHHR